MIPLFAVPVFIFGFDVLTKVLVRSRLPLGAEIPLLPFFSIVHVENTGIAFGLFQEKNLFFLLAGVLVMVGVAVMAWRMLPQDRISAYLLAVILGGALGNLTDRFFHGRVTDFLDFYIGRHHWPAFNVADSAICVGAALLIVRELVHKKNAPHSS